jgi:hypothetical protein
MAEGFIDATVQHYKGHFCIERMSLEPQVDFN